MPEIQQLFRSTVENPLTLLGVYVVFLCFLTANQKNCHQDNENDKCSFENFKIHTLNSPNSYFMILYEALRSRCSL